MRKIFYFLFLITASVPAIAKDPVMQQVWENLLMVHWEVSPKDLRKYIPPELEIRTFDGKAYIGAVALNMQTGSFTAFGDLISQFPLYSSFGQLNFRTYVSYRGKPGVHFFNLFANHKLTTIVGQNLFGLPYVNSKIQREYDGKKLSFKVTSGNKAVYSVKGAALTKPRLYPSNGLVGFLTENDLYFQIQKLPGKTCVYTGELSHRPWLLSEASAQVDVLGFFKNKNIYLEMKQLPTSLYSHYIEVDFFAPQKFCYRVP